MRKLLHTWGEGLELAIELLKHKVLDLPSHAIQMRIMKVGNPFQCFFFEGHTFDLICRLPSFMGCNDVIANKDLERQDN